jgi:hypothetical protein
MSDDRRVTRDGIHIDRDVAEAVAIEEELDSNVVGPYRFPDPRRRRTPVIVYAVVALAVGWVVDPVVALLPVAVAGWHLLGSWPLRVTQEEALSRAAGAVGFGVGHASAAMTFHGLRSRPRWSVILYSTAEPPDRRALVTVDAVSGDLVGEPYSEEL